VTPVPPLISAAADVFGVLSTSGHRGCLIDGLAVQRWGEPRATQDVDLTVLVPFGSEAAVVDDILTHIAPRTSGARTFALERRVLLLLASNGVAIDISLAGLPFEHGVLDRSSRWKQVGATWLPTCSAEDLIVYKLVAARPQDLVDVAGIVRRQATALDSEYVRRWGREFAELKEDPDLLAPFETALARAGG